MVHHEATRHGSHCANQDDANKPRRNELTGGRRDEPGEACQKVGRRTDLGDECSYQNTVQTERRHEGECERGVDEKRHRLSSSSQPDLP